MPATKIQDKAEVLRWFEEGRTYDWMSQQYLEKYGIETRATMWANFRRREELEPRITRDEGELIPWEVLPEHRHTYPIIMLRIEARRRAGRELTQRDQDRLAGWLRSRKADDTVVHYDPETEDGFFYVPRRPGVDKDLIREPGKRVKAGTHEPVRK
jgi:hypothetical protein